MTPYSQHQNDAYVRAYHVELTADLRAALAQEGSLRRMRRGFARSLVRIGARMLPDTPDIVDGHILVLRTPAADNDLHRAA
jgi:hypothetical protein